MSSEVITDDDELHRRLAPMMVKRDGTVSSVAYVRNGQPDKEISVDLARLTSTAQTLGSKMPKRRLAVAALHTV